MKGEVFNFKMNWRAFWVLAVTFALTAALAFVRIAAENTIGRISLRGYEVGQIAAEDIYSPMEIRAKTLDAASVEKGDLIVQKGYPITPEQYDILKSIADSPASTDFVSLGKSFLFLFLLAVLFYFVFSEPIINRKVRLQELIFCAISYVATYAVCSLCVGLGNFDPNTNLLLVLPVSLEVLLASFIYGNATGLFIGALCSAGVWEACGFNNLLLGYVLASSLMSARLVKNVHTRNGLVAVSLIQTFFNMIVIILLELVFEFGIPIKSVSGNLFFGVLSNIRSVLTVPLFVGVNGFLSGMLCLGLLTPLELLLNSTSPFRLKDLADMDNEIFHEMQKKAVGTYNHSLSVASMARSACDAIGARSQLAYVGAIYHDIGKLKNPEYFTENQTGIENPHDSLDPLISAAYLEKHVSDGVEKAKELGLPPQVVDIIAEHHGNSVKAYFMRKEMEINEKLPEDQRRSKEDIEEEFRYKEPCSSSRESAVVHLADSVEAASVSNKDKLLTSEDRQKLIENIVNAKIADHQLDGSGITYGDIEIIKAAFLKELNDKNYTRVKYQPEPAQEEQKTPGDADENEKTAESAGQSAKSTERPAETAEKTLRTLAVGKKTAEEKEEKKSRRSSVKSSAGKSRASKKTEDGE